MPSENRLAQLHAVRIRAKRLLVLAAVFVFLILHLIGRYTDQDVLSVSEPSGPVWADDDYSRYHNRIFKCIRVLDGDTIDIHIPDLKATKQQTHTRVRLWGMDTPEIAYQGKPAIYYGDEATEYARELLDGKNVRLELIEGKTRCYYGRLLAYVYLPDGRMFNKLALLEGYAYADHRFDHPLMERFLNLEDDSRENLRGLWREVTVDDLPKWYRKTKLREFWESRAESTVSAD